MSGILEEIENNNNSGNEIVDDAAQEQEAQAEVETQSVEEESQEPTELSEGAQPSQAETKPAAEKPQTVPVAAMLEERRKFQALRDDPEALRARLNELEGAGIRTPESPAEPKPGEPLDPSDPDPYAALEPDEFPTVRQQKDHEAWLERESIRKHTLHQQRQSALLETEARQRFTAEQCGVGLDYDTVTKTGVNFLSPKDRNLILRDADPAEKLYELCIERCPALKAYKEHLGQTVSPSGKEPETSKPKVPAAPPQTPPKVVKAPSLGRVFEAVDRSPSGLANDLDFGD